VLDVAAHEWDRLMAETAHHELQQSADVVVRFADEDACHRTKNRPRSQGLGFPDGMNHV
jgi:hypothetical protein